MSERSQFALKRAGLFVLAAIAVTISASARTAGYGRVWPSGRLQPFVSTLNSTDGRIKADATIAPAGENGAVTIFETTNTHVILDVFGYFVRQTDDPGMTFYPVAPCRVADTGKVHGSLGAPAFTLNATTEHLRPRERLFQPNRMAGSRSNRAQT